VYVAGVAEECRRGATWVCESGATGRCRSQGNPEPIAKLDGTMHDPMNCLAGSSGSGTMIRRAHVIRDYFWRGGERWKIGQLVRVSFSVWKRAEHYNPEGSRGPGGE